jgi:hypothetical protein
MGNKPVRMSQNEALRGLDRQVTKFVKANLAPEKFTDELYQMLANDCGLDPGFDKANFYQVRFRQEAERTAEFLAHHVPKEILKPLCNRIAEALKAKGKP